MSQFLYGIVTITIGIIIFYKIPKYFFIYWLLFEPLLFPIGCLLVGVVSRDDFVDFYRFTNTCARNLLVIVFLIEFSTNKCRPNMRKVWLPLSLLMLYLVFHNIISNFDIGVIWGYFSQLFSLVLVLLILMCDDRLIPSKHGLKKFLLCLVFFQFVFVIANLNGLYVYITYYIPVIMETPTGVMVESFSENLSMGTFQSFNGLANFLTTFFLIVSLEFYGNNHKSWFYYLLISFGVGFMIISSGARASVALFFIIIFMSNLAYLNNNRKSFIAGLLFLSIIIVFLFSYNTYGINESEDGKTRSFVGLANFLQSDKEDDLSTVSISRYLLDNYFFNNPITGNGLAYKGEFAYGNKGVVGLTSFSADARLAFLLVEFGIIGFLLYLFYFFSVFSLLKTKIRNDAKRKILVFFVYFFILTITENGFFDRYNLSLFFLYTYSFLRKKPMNVPYPYKVLS